jgi:hypothetical protein
MGFGAFFPNQAFACNSPHDDAQHERMYHHSRHHNHHKSGQQTVCTLSPQDNKQGPIDANDWGHCHCPNCGVSFSLMLLPCTQSPFLQQRPASVPIAETQGFYFTQYFPEGGVYGIWRPPKV